LRELGIEHVIAVGDEARVYGGEWVPTAAEAAARLREQLRPGDVVLVKGSRSVGLEVVAEKLAV
jgi:UDP-N-acetylmuramyl pentapeptide synthase